MKYLFALILTLCMHTLVASAQTLPADLTLEVIPGNPSPGTTVTLNARSYGADLNQMTLSWIYNGKTVADGIGRTSVQITAPAAGATGVITVTASGLGIETTSASVVLRPASVDLLWEAADAYTPPFYKGKALLPVGGVMRVTAIPSAAAPKSLSYTWQRNGSTLDAVSGFGKSSITLRHNALNPQERIVVNAGTGTFAGTGTLTLAPYAPLAIAYENREGYIDYAHGSDTTIRLVNPGTVLHFEPYYFSVPTSLARDISIQTTVGNDSPGQSQQNELSLSRPDTGGQNTLKLAITTVAYSLQHLEKSFTLLFN